MKKFTLLFAALTLQTCLIQALQLNKPRSKQAKHLTNIQPIISTPQQELNDALYDASINGDIEKVLELLGAGASPDAICPVTSEWRPHAIPGATALICAANRGNFEMCQILLMGNAKAEIRDRNGHNALLHAGIKKNKEIFSLLLGCTQADNASFDDLHQLETFIKKYPIEEYPKQEFMHYVDSVCLLCMKEKVQFIRRDAARMHLLHYVASWGSPEICMKLIETLRAKEITLSPQNKKGETPLHLIPVGSEYNCRLLLENKADINAQSNSEDRITDGLKLNDDTRSPLEYAERFEKQSISELFIEYGASCSPMQANMFKSEYRILKKLLYAPTKARRSESKEKIVALLRYFKRMCPQLPRDIRYCILMSICSEDIGNHMINRKLKGFTIPHVFHNHAITALCNNTIQVLYVHDVNVDEPDIRENCTKRLAKDKLLCNGEYGLMPTGCGE